MVWQLIVNHSLLDRSLITFWVVKREIIMVFLNFELRVTKNANKYDVICTKLCSESSSSEYDGIRSQDWYNNIT